MKADDLFEPKTPGGMWLDALGSGPNGDVARSTLLAELRRGPLGLDRPDLEVGRVLLRQLYDDFMAYGVGQTPRFRDDEVSEALRAARAVARRLDVHFDPPFTDYVEWREHWVAEGCHGSYGCRRDLAKKLFDPSLREIQRLVVQADAQTLGDPISPAGRTGWPAVDQEIAELRRAFRMASVTPEYANIGNSYVRLLETLSEAVWDPARHSKPNEVLPVARTKDRFNRVVDIDGAGSTNATIRNLARATIEFANHVKHGGTPTRRKAGLAADAVISLANVLRRLRDIE